MLKNKFPTILLPRTFDETSLPSLSKSLSGKSEPFLVSVADAEIAENPVSRNKRIMYWFNFILQISSNT